MPLLRLKRSTCVLFWVVLASLPARADVAVIVEESIGTLGELSGTGHAALYFSNLCAETPVQLRACKPGEDGAVVSTYQDWGDNGHYKWLAIPRAAFLYGTESISDAPLYANKAVLETLQARYRAEHLSAVIPEDGKGRWRDLIGSALRRDSYFITIATTPEQDQTFLSNFEHAPNRYDFNIFYNNCSDFVSSTINALFPEATHRDLINDFGLSTPKAIARSFIEYATGRRELNLRITKFTQADQTTRRSNPSRNVSEQGIKSKKYILAAAVIQPVSLAAFGGLYFAKGRFNIDDLATGSASDEQWAKWKQEIDRRIAGAVESGFFANAKQVTRFASDLENSSEVRFDAQGQLTLTTNERTVGITRGNILAPQSDRTLAYKLLLSKLAYMTQASKANRPSANEFEATLELLISMY